MTIINLFLKSYSIIKNNNKLTLKNILKPSWKFLLLLQFQFFLRYLQKKIKSF